MLCRNNLRAALPLAALLTLNACGVPRPQTVSVPVPVSCVSEIPARPDFPAVNKADGLFVRVQKLLAERELRIAYEGKLEAVLAACR